MTIETCLTIMVITQLLLVAFLFFVFFKVRKSAKNLYVQVEKTSAEAQQLFTNLNAFASSDLHLVSSEFADLISQTSSLVSNLNTKPDLLDFILKSLNALNSEKTSFSSEQGSESKKGPIYEIIKWVPRGLVLFKLTRRLMKNHGK